jgi:hypothetical protein
MVHDMIVNRPGRYCVPVKDDDESFPYTRAELQIEEDQLHELDLLARALGPKATWTWPSSLQYVWYNANEKFRQGVEHLWREENDDVDGARAPLPIEDWETLPEVDELQRWTNDKDSHIHYAVADNDCENCHLLYVQMRTSSNWEPGELAAAMAPTQEATVTHSGPLREDLVIS